MAWAVDQASIGTNSSTGSATTIVLTTSAAVASGAWIFLVVGHFNASVTLSSVSGGSLTWTIVQVANNAGVRAALVKAQAPSGLASGTAITATYSGTTNERKIGGASFTGGAGTTSNNTTATGSTTGWSVNPTTGAAELAVAAASIDANNTSTQDANSTELLDFAAGTVSRSFLYYRIGGAPVGGTFSAGAAWAVAGGSFANSGGGGGGTAKPRRALMGVGR